MYCSTIKNLHPKEFETYFKFCVIRNPWDVMVSMWFFTGRKISFKEFCKNNSPANWERILIDQKPSCDYYIRYENLKRDVQKVCKILNIIDEDINSLGSYKSKFRNEDKHYSTYYDDETINIVQKKYHEEIGFFKYQFQRPGVFSKLFSMWNSWNYNKA